MIPFFVRPDDCFQWMPCLNFSLIQSAHHFNRSHAADVAIEITAVQHRVDMRTENQFRQHLRTRTQPEDIPRRVDSHFESRLLHQAFNVLPRSQVSFRKTQAGDAALLIPSKLGQPFKRALQAFRVDIERRRIGILGVAAHRAGQQKDDEIEVAHRGRLWLRVRVLSTNRLSRPASSTSFRFVLQ
jgi:hypothetical protein